METVVTASLEDASKESWLLFSVSQTHSQIAMNANATKGIYLLNHARYSSDLDLSGERFELREDLVLIVNITLQDVSRDGLSSV